MEVLKKHKEELESEEKPVLAVIDEILNGTDPNFAADYSYQILQERNEAHLNCLSLLTTHFMKLTKLAEANKHIFNKKVVVKIPGTKGRKFDPTFKIHDGIADQNIVAAMLEEKGIFVKEKKE